MNIKTNKIIKKTIFIFSKRDIYIPFLLLILLSIPFYIWDLDIIISTIFNKEMLKNNWPLKIKCPWNYLYNFGTWPAIGLSIFSLVFLVFSLIKKVCLRFRKQLLYLVLVMVIGPGLLVNVIFKGNFGRPRPRNIQEFGGNKEYHQLWKSNWGGKGRAFPCGHCSAAFYFFAFYFLLKNKNKKWPAYIALSSATIYGILMGIARIGQGGHFASDVLWSAGFVYFTAGILYYGLLQKNQLENV